MLESLGVSSLGLKTCNLIKKRLQHKCFPLNTAFFIEHLRWMLLCFQKRGFAGHHFIYNYFLSGVCLFFSLYTRDLELQEQKKKTK